MTPDKSIEKLAKTLVAPPAEIGADGKAMSSWQLWLKRLCTIVIAWAAFELVLAAALAAAYLVNLPLVNNEIFAHLNSSSSMMALFGAFLNLIIGILGIRGAKDPRKITLFFWITFIDAMLTAWSLASSVSLGASDLTSMVSGLFIIALAVCAWQVRGQTGYFDVHP